MFNMFVVTLAPFKSHCYFFFIYLPCKKYRSSKSKLTYFRNRDIVYWLEAESTIFYGKYNGVWHCTM